VVMGYAVLAGSHHAPWLPLRYSWPRLSSPLSSFIIFWEADMNSSHSVAHAALSLLSGVLFALGLALSQMVNPAKVLNFLDVAGDWDPTLAFVMGGALLITIPAFRLVLRRAHPLLETKFYLPTKLDIDVKLIAGAALFGSGW